MKRGAEGAITVFSAFVLFLILSLVLVSLESARQQGATTLVQMNMNTAMESVLGEYYAPLYEEYDMYGLFGIDVEERMRTYMEATAQPQKHLPDSYVGSRASYYSFAYEISNVRLQKATYLTDGGGALCKLQMIEAGLYCGIEAVAEELLEAVSLLEEMDETLHVLEKKVAVEEQLTAIDEAILRLMPCLDGISTGEDGVVFDKDGNACVEDFFAKQLTPANPTAEAVRVNNPSLYRRLVRKYVDGEAYLKRMLMLADGMNTENATERSAQLRGEQGLLQAIVHSTLAGTEEALTIIEELRRLQEQLQPTVSGYGAVLESAESLVEEGMYASLTEAYERMKSYVGLSSQSAVYDFATMEKTLRENRQILLAMEELFVPIPAGVGKKDWENAYTAMAELWKGYSFEGLQLDYSAIRRTTASENSVLKSIKEHVLKGITAGLFADDSVMSERRIQEKELPSSIMDGEASDLFANLLPKEGQHINMEFVRELLSGKGLSRMLGLLADGAEALAEKLLLLVYIKEHFPAYIDGAEKGALLYQQEYLLFGEDSDEANVRAAAMCILGLRLLMNVIHTFTSAEKSAVAFEFATAITASVGLPFLAGPVQYVLQFLWALQNAQIETTALLLGKKIPMLVRRESFCVSFEEILTLTKEKRMERAGSCPESGGVSPGYAEYLLIFMLLRDEEVLVARAMDMIQCNLRLYYNPSFELQKCIYGFEASCDASLPTLYTRISFGGYKANANGYFSITTEGATAY